LRWIYPRYSRTDRGWCRPSQGRHRLLETSSRTNETSNSVHSPESGFHSPESRDPRVLRSRTASPKLHLRVSRPNPMARHLPPRTKITSGRSPADTAPSSAHRRSEEPSHRPRVEMPSAEPSRQLPGPAASDRIRSLPHIANPIARGRFAIVRQANQRTCKRLHPTLAAGAVLAGSRAEPRESCDAPPPAPHPPLPTHDS